MGELPGAAMQATTCTQSHPCVARTSSQSGASRRHPFPASATPRWPTYTLRPPPQARIEGECENRRAEQREDQQDRGHGRWNNVGQDARYSEERLDVVAGDAFNILTRRQLASIFRLLSPASP